LEFGIVKPGICRVKSGIGSQNFSGKIWKSLEMVSKIWNWNCITGNWNYKTWN
jgi:hypothetical protein